MTDYIYVIGSWFRGPLPPSAYGLGLQIQDETPWGRVTAAAGGAAAAFQVCCCQLLLAGGPSAWAAAADWWYF